MSNSKLVPSCFAVVGLWILPTPLGAIDSFTNEPPLTHERPVCSALLLEVDALVEHSWVDAKFSIPFLRGLKSISEEEVYSEFGFEPTKLRQAASLFHHQPEGMEALVTTTHLAKKEGPGAAPTLVLLFVLKSGEHTAAFLAISLPNNDGHTEIFGEFLKADTTLPQTRGVGRSYANFIREFSRALEIRAERMEAGWAGRPIWARLAYEFDPQATFREQGVLRSQVELAQRNFARFLHHHGISERDLYIRSPQGNRLPFALEALRTPADFLSVRHSRGPVVQFRPYIDADTLGEVMQAHPGLAFSLWDYRPRPGQTVAIDQQGKALSDIAMPTWIAIRRFADSAD